MPCDHDPNDETVLPTGGSPLPPADQHWRMMLAQAEDDLAKAHRTNAMLSAKNQSLTDALNTSVLEACEEIDGRLKPEIERLTAENARLKGALKKAKADRLSEWKAANRAEAEVERLTSERDELRLQCLAHEGQVHAAYEAQKRAEAERQSLREACVSFLGQIAYVEADGAYYVTTDQADALEAAVRATPNALVASGANWYAEHRSQVEAAHAAAKEDAQ